MIESNRAIRLRIKRLVGQLRALDLMIEDSEINVDHYALAIAASGAAHAIVLELLRVLCEKNLAKNS